MGGGHIEQRRRKGVGHRPAGQSSQDIPGSAQGEQMSQPYYSLCCTP